MIWCFIWAALVYLTPLLISSVTNDYDSNFRRTSARVAGYGATLNSYTYDTANRLATVGDGTNVANYTYLANSPLVSQILSKVSGSTKLTTTRNYDFLDRLQSVSSAPSAANMSPFYFGYNYNIVDQRTAATMADGTYWTYAYDSLGQLTNAVNHWPDTSPVPGEQYSYTFDDIGNRKSTKQGGDSRGQNLRSATYSVNTLNQITSRGVPNAVDVIGNSTATNSVTVNGSGVQYSRPPFFRHELSVSNGSGPAYTGVTVTAATTKTGNILTPPATQNFTYDTDGNTTNDSDWTFIYDGENRLIEVQPLTNNPAASKRWLKMTYDWQGRRIQKSAAAWSTNSSAWSVTVSNRFLYSGWNMIGELNATNNNLIRAYTWGKDLSGTFQGAGGVGGLVSLNDPANGVHFPAYDEAGNIVGLVKNDGTVSAQYEYDPFGQIIRATGTMALINPFRFSTKYNDDEDGLSNFGRRPYSANLGKWGNRDPIQEWGGFNIYGFCHNDPIGCIDPFGLEWYDSIPVMGPLLARFSGRAIESQMLRAHGYSSDEMLRSLDPNAKTPETTGNPSDVQTAAALTSAGAGLDLAVITAMTPEAKGTEALEGLFTACRAKRPIGAEIRAGTEAAEAAGEAVNVAKNTGPGRIMQISESMSARAAAYQSRITGLPAGTGYVANGVKFDGFANGVLLDAKGPDYAGFVKNGQFQSWWSGADGFVRQAQQQLQASGGVPIQWHFAEQAAANATKNLFQQRGIGGIEVIFTP